jgi:hypothetical protein
LRSGEGEGGEREGTISYDGVKVQSSITHSILFDFKYWKGVSLMNGIGVGTDPGTTHPPWEKNILGKRRLFISK